MFDISMSGPRRDMQPYIFHPGRQMMQPVLLSTGGPAPVFTNTVQPPLAAAGIMRPELQMHPPPTSRSQPVGLYLCTTTHTATEPPVEEREREKEKAPLEFVEKSYQELNSKKIKDSLSSFLADIPGEFDSIDSPDTMLRHLIDHRPIGGKEFLPLSGQALLGFRLLPGALPEQYKMDPSSLEPKTHHRKRKHKHKSLDRTEDSSETGPPPSQAKLPSDAYNFIRQELPPSVVHVAPPSHTLTTPMVIQTNKGIPGQGHLSYPSMGAIPNVAPPPTIMADSTRMSVFDGQKRKKKKRDKDKERKKDKKEKKKKREKHHSQDPPGASSIPPPLLSHPPGQPSYKQYPPS